MNKRSLWLQLLPCLCAGAVVCNAEAAKAASLLSFDGLSLPLSGSIPGTYGDNLLDTPNIQIEYRTVNPITGATFADHLDFWPTDYGTLTDVAYPVSNGYLGEISLIPEAGYAVTLESFDLAGWRQTDQLNQTVRILDEGFNILLDYSPFTVEGDAGFSAFTPMITRAGTLRIQFGPSWDTGIDNVRFSQSGVPVPTPALLPGLIGLGLSAWRKRQQKHEHSELHLP